MDNFRLIFICVGIYVFAREFGEIQWCIDNYIQFPLMFTAGIVWKSMYSHLTLNAGGVKMENKLMCLPKMDNELKWILGRPGFTLLSEVQVLRLIGHDITCKAEDEQAAVLYWMLNLYLKHGSNWREEGQKILKSEMAKLKEDEQ